jgi:hypothetical protein
VGKDIGDWGGRVKDYWLDVIGEDEEAATSRGAVWLRPQASAGVLPMY